MQQDGGGQARLAGVRSTAHCCSRQAQYRSAVEHQELLPSVNSGAAAVLATVFPPHCVPSTLPSAPHLSSKHAAEHARHLL